MADARVSRTPVERLLLSLEAFSPRPKHTLIQYRSIAQKFLDRYGERPSRDSILEHIQDRRADGTKQYVWGVLRSLYMANEWHWPFLPRQGPKVKESYRPSLTSKQVADLIAASRIIENRDTAYLALSTTYGFRRDELARCTMGVLHDGGASIKIISAKTSAVREHSVPEPIRPYLGRLPDRPLSLETMSLVFNRICLDAGVDVAPRSGWHSIRRSLSHELHLLSEVVPPHHANRFFGWRTGSIAMFEHYANPELKQADAAVFAHHPFIPCWE